MNTEVDVTILDRQLNVPRRNQFSCPVRRLPHRTTTSCAAGFAVGRDHVACAVTACRAAAVAAAAPSARRKRSDRPDESAGGGGGQKGRASGAPATVERLVRSREIRAATHCFPPPLLRRLLAGTARSLWIRRSRRTPLTPAGPRAIGDTMRPARGIGECRQRKAFVAFLVSAKPSCCFKRPGHASKLPSSALKNARCLCDGARERAIFLSFLFQRARSVERKAVGSDEAQCAAFRQKERARSPPTHRPHSEARLFERRARTAA